MQGSHKVGDVGWRAVEEGLRMSRHFGIGDSSSSTMRASMAAIRSSYKKTKSTVGAEFENAESRAGGVNRYGQD